MQLTYNGAGGQPEYHCQVPEGASVNDTIPRNDKGAFEKCYMYVSQDNNNKTECNEWQYFGDVGHTIVSQVTIIVIIIILIIIINLTFNLSTDQSLRLIVPTANKK